jgi:hypothetical protein
VELEALSRRIVSIPTWEGFLHLSVTAWLGVSFPPSQLWVVAVTIHSLCAGAPGLETTRERGTQRFSPAVVTPAPRRTQQTARPGAATRCCPSTAEVKYVCEGKAHDVFLKNRSCVSEKEFPSTSLRAHLIGYNLD